MARQILTGSDAHQAALALLKAGYLDSNPVALEDGAFEVALKPEVSDHLHAAEVSRLVGNLQPRLQVTPSVNIKLILVGQRAYEMAENVWLNRAIFGRKPQDLAQGIVLVNRIRVYGLPNQITPAYQAQFRNQLKEIGSGYNPQVVVVIPTPVDLLASGYEFPRDQAVA